MVIKDKKSKRIIKEKNIWDELLNTESLNFLKFYSVDYIHPSNYYHSTLKIIVKNRFIIVYSNPKPQVILLDKIELI